MEIVFFWIVWGALSFWALRTFYYSFSKEKLERLRKAVLGINLAILVLTFLPWLPQAYDGKSGWTLAFEGNILALLFIIFTIISAMIFSFNESALLELGSFGTIANTFILFILMFQLRPGNIILTFYDIAPIVAILFLLVGDVISLLLWQQLQLKTRK